MSQLVLEFSNQDDLMLLLSFAKRLNAKIVSVNKVDEKRSSRTDFARQLALMQQAANDPLFREDVDEVMTDFAHSDKDDL